MTDSARVAESLAVEFLQRAAELVTLARTQPPHDASLAAPVNRFNISTRAVLLSEQVVGREGSSVTLDVRREDVPHSQHSSDAAADEPGATLLERWTWAHEVGVEPQSRGVQESYRGHDVAVVYKRAVITLRALHCLLRVLPAHRYAQLQQNAGCPFRLVVTRLDGEDAALAPDFGSAATSAFDFAQLETPFGRLSGRVVYSTAAFAGQAWATVSSSMPQEERPATATHFNSRLSLRSMALAPPAARVDVGPRDGGSAPVRIPRQRSVEETYLQRAETELGGSPRIATPSPSPSMPFALTPQPHSGSSFFLSGAYSLARRASQPAVGDGLLPGVTRRPSWSLASSLALSTSIAAMSIGGASDSAAAHGHSLGSSGRSSPGGMTAFRAATSSSPVERAAMEQELPFALDVDTESGTGRTEAAVGALINLLQQDAAPGMHMRAVAGGVLLVGAWHNPFVHALAIPAFSPRADATDALRELELYRSA